MHARARTLRSLRTRARDDYTHTRTFVLCSERRWTQSCWWSLMLFSRHQQSRRWEEPSSPFSFFSTHTTPTFFFSLPRYLRLPDICTRQRERNSTLEEGEHLYRRAFCMRTGMTAARGTSHPRDSAARFDEIEFTLRATSKRCAYIAFNSHSCSAFEMMLARE